ncbi:MAG: hypothetical protein QOD43_623 [Gaiellaceae bacterium]|nr:hypothetical protein [Gaiellaceae bacterium]
MLSPAEATAAAARTTNGTLRSPLDATTPAVITELSLGTSGTTASRNANTRRIAHAHPDASDTSYVNCSNKHPAQAAPDPAARSTLEVPPRVAEKIAQACDAGAGHRQRGC